MSGSATATFYNDGDGNRIKATVSGTTTAYIGSYFEWIGPSGTMIKYYYAGGVRVAMRTGSNDPLWLLGDHLGSTSKVANYNGLSEHSQQMYKPWGEKRYPTGAPTLPTTFRFTGQRSETGLGPSGGEGLYFYNSRWYDSALGRFVQADTVIPNPGNSQSFDRFAYVGNNPVRYIDPTGHRSDCTEQEIAASDETCEENYSVDDLSSSLQYLYGWNIMGDWSVEELITLIDAAMDIISYVNEITSGGGASWFREVTGDININRVGGVSNYVLGNTVNMTFSWLKDPDNKEIFAHELAHVWDNRTATMHGSIGATWYGGGAADELTKYVGGEPRNLRFINGTSGIPIEYQWDTKKSGGGYGNHSTADYFAESFGWMIYDSSAVPQGNISWLRTVIALQSNGDQP